MGKKPATPCVIPEKASIEAIRQVTLPEPDHKRDEISDYVEWQVNKRDRTRHKVVHLERVKTEVVMGTEHVVWDVHTDEPGRWWVVTGPTNLYSQALFPSLDYTLSFHVGLMARVASRETKRAPKGNKARLTAAWRRWETVTEALDEAREAEDFQAVGMRCRETLIALVKSLRNAMQLPTDVAPPKASNVVDWFSLIAQSFAPGARNEHVRSYMRSAARETWQLVNWLTHTTSANLHEAQLALEATSNLLTMTSRVVMHFEGGAPSSCPDCGSYRIASVFDPEITREPPYVALCESCGWHNYDEEEEIAKDGELTREATE